MSNETVGIIGAFIAFGVLIGIPLGRMVWTRTTFGKGANDLREAKNALTHARHLIDFMPRENISEFQSGEIIQAIDDALKGINDELASRITKREGV